MSFADEVESLMTGLSADRDEVFWTVGASGLDAATVYFCNVANPTRKTAIFLDRGCDLSCLAAAVALQVLAVTSRKGEALAEFYRIETQADYLDGCPFPWEPSPVGWADAETPINILKADHAPLDSGAYPAVRRRVVRVTTEVVWESPNPPASAPASDQSAPAARRS